MEGEVSLPEPDTASMAMSGRSVDYINGYESGYEAAADKVRAAILAERERSASLCDERATDCEESHAGDNDERWLVYAKHARRLAAAIRSGTAPAKEGK